MRPFGFCSFGQFAHSIHCLDNSHVFLELAAGVLRCLGPHLELKLFATAPTFSAVLKVYVGDLGFFLFFALEPTSHGLGFVSSLVTLARWPS